MAKENTTHGLKEPSPLLISTFPLQKQHSFPVIRYLENHLLEELPGLQTQQQ